DGFVEEIEILPACFRCARGWLITGNVDHAAAFGVNLLFDEDAARDSLASSEVASRGRLLCDSWSRAISGIPVGNLLTELASIPTFQWSEHLGISARTETPTPVFQTPDLSRLEKIRQDDSATNQLLTMLPKSSRQGLINLIANSDADFQWTKRMVAYAVASDRTHSALVASAAQYF